MSSFTIGFLVFWVDKGEKSTLRMFYLIVDTYVKSKPSLFVVIIIGGFSM